MLSTFCHDHPRDWDQYLFHVEEAYRQTKHPSTGVEPDVAMMGFRPRNFMDIEFPPLPDDLASDAHMRVLQEQEKQRLVKEEILQRIEKSQSDQEYYANKTRIQFRFITGDRVWFYWPSRKTNIPQKLSLPWSGPYYVYERLSPATYRLQFPDGKLFRQIVNVDRLKPCPPTLGPPTEFVTLHENDTFDIAREQDTLELPNYSPVIDEVTPEARERTRLLNEVETSQKPRQSSLQRYQEEYDRLLKQEPPNEPVTNAKLKNKSSRTRIEVVSNRLNKYKRQQERNKNLKDEPTDVAPRFYDRTKPKFESNGHNETEPEFVDPMHMKDLYTALKNVYALYHGLPSLTNISAAKKTLKLILSPPNIVENHRIEHFSKQIGALRSYDEFIDFLKNCFAHFTEIFSAEIARESK